MSGYFAKRMGCLLIIATVAQGASIKIEQWQNRCHRPSYLIERGHAGILDVSLQFHAGSYYDQSHWGLAVLANRLLGESSQTLSAKQLADQLERTGAQLEQVAGREWAYLHLRTLSDPQYRQPATRLLGQLLKGPKPSNTQIALAKQQQLAEVAAEAEDPSNEVEAKLMQTLYRNPQAYHNPLGNRTRLNPIDRKILLRFIRRYYNRHNATILMVGQIKLAEAKQLADQLCQQLPNGKTAPEPSFLLRQKNINIYVPKTTEQTTFLWSKVGYPPDHRLYWPMKLGTYILGGLPLNSLLFDTIREQHGLAYSVSSWIRARQASSQWFLFLQTKQQSAQQAWRLAEQTYTTLSQAGPSRVLMDRAKNNFIGQLLISTSTSQGQLAFLAQVAARQRPLDEMDRIIDAIKSVTPEQITEALSGLKAHLSVAVAAGSSNPFISHAAEKKPSPA